jgi:hypothetical protein
MVAGTPFDMTSILRTEWTIIAAGALRCVPSALNAEYMLWRRGCAEVPDGVDCHIMAVPKSGVQAG